MDEMYNSLENCFSKQTVNSRRTGLRSHRVGGLFMRTVTGVPEMPLNCEATNLKAKATEGEPLE